MKLGIAILSHNRLEQLKSAVSSISCFKWDDVIISDNSTDIDVRNGLKFILDEYSYIRCSLVNDNGLFPNLENLVRNMQPDISYLLLCDDDLLVIDSIELEKLRDADITPVLRARQPNNIGWKFEQDGNINRSNNAWHYFLRFPNLAFAGSFVESRIYKKFTGKYEKLGNEFDLFLIGEQIRSEGQCYITSKSYYIFNVHAGQISSKAEPFRFLASVPFLLCYLLNGGKFIVFSIYLRALIYSAGSWAKRLVSAKKS